MKNVKKEPLNPTGVVEESGNSLKTVKLLNTSTPGLSNEIAPPLVDPRSSGNLLVQLGSAVIGQDITQPMNQQPQKPTPPVEKPIISDEPPLVDPRNSGNLFTQMGSAVIGQDITQPMNQRPQGQPTIPEPVIPNMMTPPIANVANPYQSQPQQPIETPSMALDDANQPITAPGVAQEIPAAGDKTNIFDQPIVAPTYEAVTAPTPDVKVEPIPNVAVETPKKEEEIDLEALKNTLVDICNINRKAIEEIEEYMRLQKEMDAGLNNIQETIAKGEAQVFGEPVIPEQNFSDTQSLGR